MASTTYNEPFNLARTFTSIDHLSKESAAWNIVTSYYENDALNFGLSRHPNRKRCSNLASFSDELIK